MKSSHFLISLLSVIFPLFVTGSMTAAEQVVDEVPLHTDSPANGGLHAPTVCPITCYLYSSIESLILSSNTITENALVLLENTITGDYSMDEVYLSSVPATLPLLGPGNYSITITLSSGAVYFGVFSYNI